MPPKSAPSFLLYERADDAGSLHGAGGTSCAELGLGHHRLTSETSLPALGSADRAGDELPVVALRVGDVGLQRHGEDPSVADLVRRDYHVRRLVGDLGVEDLVVLLEYGLLGRFPLGAVLGGFSGYDVGELMGQQLRCGTDRRLGRDADDRRAAVVREYGQAVGCFPVLVLEVWDVLRVVSEARV